MGSEKYKVVGIMSGTSLDGVDIVYCEFKFKANKWSFDIIKASTIPYNQEWINLLQNLETKDAFTIMQSDQEFGFYLGELVKSFIDENDLDPDLISSHGHTIFHSVYETKIWRAGSEKRLTTQIGNGSAISAICSLPVVCDFRSLDVALGGQGAPLVPIGDKKLFSGYDYCLNLGGFANVSYDLKDKRIAFDICPVNIVMNELSKELGEDYDEGGKVAASGRINTNLFKGLNELTFYNTPPHQPKSLGKEWVVAFINPLLDIDNIALEDKMHTFSHHVSHQITKTLNELPKGNLLITGGGAYNSYLVDRLILESHHRVTVPDKRLVDFKEGLIFGFLGVLRYRNENNCLSSVTGATRDNCGGAIYYP